MTLKLSGLKLYIADTLLSIWISTKFVWYIILSLLDAHAYLVVHLKSTGAENGLHCLVIGL